MAVPIISPAGPLAKRGKQTQVFNITNGENVTWTKTGGTFSNVAVQSVTWTAPNKAGSYTVTATNGAAQAVSVTITVTPEFPFSPSWPYDGSEDSTTNTSTTPDLRVMSVTRSDTKGSLEFVKNSVETPEFLEARQFCRDNAIGVGFYWTHPDTEEESLWIRTSKFSYRSVFNYLWSYSMTFRQK